MPRRSSFFLTLVFVLTAAQAQARPSVSATMTQSIVKYGANGRATLAAVDAAPLKPGTVLEYTITAVNGSTEPALNLKPVAKIPEGTTYKPGSAVSGVPGAKLEFSLDAGKTWAAVPTIRVQTPAGVVQRPAPVSMYRAIRWLDATNLTAKAHATFTYDVVVK